MTRQHPGFVSLGGHRVRASAVIAVEGGHGDYRSVVTLSTGRALTLYAETPAEVEDMIDAAEHPDARRPHVDMGPP